jgi:hypothetical protein
MEAPEAEDHLGGGVGSSLFSGPHGPDYPMKVPASLKPD